MPTNRLIPVNLRLPENLLKDSDRLAEQEGSSRTELVRSALHSYIQRRQKLQSVFGIVKKQGKAMGINTPEDLTRVLEEVQVELHGN